MTELTTTPKPRAKRGTGPRALKSREERADLAILALKRIYESSNDETRKLIRLLITGGGSREPAIMREAMDAAALIDETQAQDVNDLFEIIDARKGA